MDEMTYFGVSTKRKCIMTTDSSEYLAIFSSVTCFAKASDVDLGQQAVLHMMECLEVQVNMRYY